MNRKSFTLFEILISTLILALLTAGLANLFIAGKRHILHSRSRITGGEIGKIFIDPLQMEVTQTERSSGQQNGWNEPNNALKEGTRYCDSDLSHTQQPTGFCPDPPAKRTLDGIEYSARYEIIKHPQDEYIRKVVTTISWTERQP